MSKMPLILSLCLAVVLSYGAAVVADDGFPSLQQPASSRTISFGYQDPAANAPAAAAPAAAAPAAAAPAAAAPAADAPAAKSPSDVAPPVAKPATEPDCATCTEPVCSSDACGKGAAPWTIPQPCVLQNMGIKAGGWLQQGWTANNQYPLSHFNGPVALNDRDEYEMNQAWLFLDRPTNTGGCGWDIGGHVDVVYGTDWRFGQGWGLENHINSEDQLYGWVLPQMYGEVAVNNLTVRGGRMAGLLCYEQVPAVANFFYSHSYTMTYTEPQLITGVVGDYKLSDGLSVQAGIHQGWYMWEDVNDHKDFIGGVNWASSDKKTQIGYHLDNGWQNNLAQMAQMKNWFAHSFVFQQQLSGDLKYVFQHNLGVAQDMAPGDEPGTFKDARWYTINQYLFYTINPRWSAGARIEWMRDRDGVKVAGLAANPDFAGVRAWDGFGYAGDFYEFTMGLNYRPSPNWVIRPECRWDWYNGARSWALDNLPFGDGSSDNQFTFAVDAIVTF
jgi:hypothetical protein